MAPCNGNCQGLNELATGRIDCQNEGQNASSLTTSRRWDRPASVKAVCPDRPLAAQRDYLHAEPDMYGQLTGNKKAGLHELLIPLSPLLILISSSRYVTERLPLADSGAVTGKSPRILNCLNCTSTWLSDTGVSSAVT